MKTRTTHADRLANLDATRAALQRAHEAAGGQRRDESDEDFEARVARRRAAEKAADAAAWAHIAALIARAAAEDAAA